MFDKIIEAITGCRAKQEQLIAKIHALETALSAALADAAKAQAALDALAAMQADADKALTGFTPSGN